MLLYWQMGRDILEYQDREGWETKMIDRLAHDLRTAFPGMKGFSRTNLMSIRGFAQAWPKAIVQQAVGQLPWGDNLVLLAKLKNPAQRLAYAQRTIEYGWSGRRQPSSSSMARGCCTWAEATGCGWWKTKICR